MTDEIEELKEKEKGQDEKKKSRNNSWLGGVVLILIGLFFLASNFAGINFTNWWALFILIPAIASFRNAYQKRQEAGRFTKDARGSLMGGLILIFIASVFLLSLDWGKIWPVFIIFAGISVLLNVIID